MFVITFDVFKGHHRRWLQICLKLETAANLKQRWRACAHFPHLAFRVLCAGRKLFSTKFKTRMK